MADSDIVVQIVARIDQLESGLKQAVTALQASTQSMQTAIEQVGKSNKETHDSIETLSIGAVIAATFEAGKKALEELKELYHETVQAAEQFALSNAKFAAQLGTSTERASGLSLALGDVGSSADEYAMMALRLEMRLKTNEAAFNSLGVKTRDANGHLLDGEHIMRNALDTMASYKAGTDQNSFALEVFGRGARNVYDIVRVNEGLIQENIADMKQLGVETGGPATQAAMKYELAVARMNDKFEEAKIALGQKLLPILTNLINFITENQTVWDGLAAGIRGVGDAATFILTSLREVWELLVLIKSIGSVLITGELNMKGWNEIKGVLADMRGIWSEAGNVKAGSTLGESLLEGGTGYPSGTNTYKPPPTSDQLAKQRAMNDELIASAKNLAEAEIAIESDKNQYLLASGQRTVDEFVAMARALEDRRYEIQRSALEQRIVADKTDLVAQKRDKDALLLLEKQHQLAVQKIDEDGQAKRELLARQETQTAIQENQERMRAEVEHVQAMLNRKDLTIEEAIALEQRLTDAVFQQNIARLNAEIRTLQAGTKAYHEAVAQREKLEQEWARSNQRLTDQLVAHDRAKWNELASSTRSSLQSALNGMLTATMTWRQALISILDSILTAFADMALNMLLDWVESEIRKAIFTDATEKATAVTKITVAAGVAGANAYAQWAAYPPVAAAMAAEAVGATMSFASFAAAEQGMEVDRDQFVFAHEKEMILPAPISIGLKNLISSGGAGPNTRGGDTFVLSPIYHLNMIDGSGAEEFAKQHAAVLTREVTAFMDRNPSARPSFV